VARVAFIVLVALGTSAGAIFTIDPAIDLRVASSLAAVAARDEASPFFQFLLFVREAGPYVVAAAVAPAVLALLMRVLRLRRRAPMSQRAALFVILSLLLGPGLLVNGILKEHWGRPRPGSVTEFGGDLVFKPWWDPRGGCNSNCSFVSGETSSATWLAAPAILVPAPWRYLALSGAALYTVLIALARLLAGGHFLSDVIFAGIFTGLVIWAVHGFLYRWPSTRPDDRTLDMPRQQIGEAASRLFGAMASPRKAPPDKQAPPARK
jgi:lipid A 4'-phosphatase